MRKSFFLKKTALCLLIAAMVMGSTGVVSAAGRGAEIVRASVRVPGKEDVKGTPVTEKDEESGERILVGFLLKDGTYISLKELDEPVPASLKRLIAEGEIESVDVSELEEEEDSEKKEEKPGKEKDEEEPAAGEEPEKDAEAAGEEGPAEEAGAEEEKDAEDGENDGPAADAAPEEDPVVLQQPALLLLSRHLPGTRLRQG